MSTLTARQRQIMVEISYGRTRPEIAADLGIRCDTVGQHIRDAVARLGARNTTHAVAVGLTTGALR